MLQARGKVHILSSKWIQFENEFHRWPQEQVEGRLLLLFRTFKILNHVLPS